MARTGTLEQEQASMASMEVSGLSLGESSSAEFGMVSKDMVPHAWPLVEPMLQEKGKRWLEVVSEAEVFEWLCSGRAELWMAMDCGILDGFVIGHWENNARRRRYSILFVAGNDLDKYIKKGLEKLEQYCCILGGTELAFEGRRGWIRKLRSYGYSSPTVLMRKPTKLLWRN